MLKRKCRTESKENLSLVAYLVIYNNISSLQEFVERSNDFFDC